MAKFCKLAIFADNIVGIKILKFLLEFYPDDIVAIFCTDRNSLVYNQFINGNEKLQLFTSFVNDFDNRNLVIELEKIEIDYIILAWWPYILKPNIISIPKIGVLNFHPSMLPHNRGKHYNFWTIVENTPFGVSIHFVDDSIDGGDIIFQKSIDKDWCDTGQTLYSKAQNEMIDLFINSYEKIRDGKYKRVKQNRNEGSFHYARELHGASKIELDKTYPAREILNLLRAKTFPPYPAAWFESNGEVYEVSISIKKCN